MDWGAQVTILGTTTLKEHEVNFGIKDTDRTRHLYLLGKVGSGRGEIVTQMALQDIARGMGTLVLDASGKVAPALMERIDQGAADRIIYLDPAHAEYPYSWNPLDDIRALPEGVRIARLDDLLTAVYRVETKPIIAALSPHLLQKKDATIISVYQVATDEKARKDFFADEEEQKKFEAILAASPEAVKTLEDHGRYVAKDTLIRNLLGQSASKFNLTVLAHDAIVIVDFSRIRMFPTRMTPVVRTFVEAARAAAQSTATPIALYLQDTVRYLGDSEIERTMSDPHLALTVADTVIQESDRERREKVLARSGSLIALATHSADRALVERAFLPFIPADEILALNPREMAVALTIDGVRGKPFFARTRALPPHTSLSYQDLLVSARDKYTLPRSRVDALWKPPKKDAPPPDKQPPGFSDTFRSIFAKRGGGTVSATPSDATPATPAPQVAKPAEPKEKKKKADAPAPETQEANASINEIPEATLRDLLYVPLLNA